ncbi:MAG: nickel insertion protein, partial [Gemmatimonadales bacterium]
AAPEDADHVARELFRHSTTAGVRRSVVRRETLERRTLDVRLGPDINVRVKVLDPDGNRRLKAEYDDVLVAAGALHEPAHEVARRAELMAELELKERGS